jgi:hypothetical protein
VKKAEIKITEDGTAEGCVEATSNLKMALTSERTFQFRIVTFDEK